MTIGIVRYGFMMLGFAFDCMPPVYAGADPAPVT